MSSSKQRNAMTLSQLLSSLLGTPKSGNFNFERLLNLNKPVYDDFNDIYVVIVWVHSPTPGQMRLYAVVGVASLPTALPMHSSVEAHSSLQLHQTQWRYSYKYPFRLGDNLQPTFVFLNIRKLSSSVWSWWLPWSLKRLRQKEVPSRWWKTGQL